MKTMILAALIVASLPADAQTAPAPAPAPPAAAPAAPVDSSRLAAATPVAVKIWPIGTYRRIMSGTMDRMMDAMLTSMMGMKLGDLAGLSGADKITDGDGKAVDGALGDATMGEMATAVDPHFAERTRISTRVMFDEMGALMARVEPDIQVAVAHGLARRFTVAELAEIGRFFDTPLGARYAADSMLLATEPEMIGAMTKFMPDLMKSMPAIMKKVEAATAHLPPPPKPAGDAGADEDEAAPTGNDRS